MNSAADMLWHDADARDVYLRELITERLVQHPPPASEDAIVATYFFALRSLRLDQAGEEIAYHATSGERQPIPGSLIAACTAQAVGIDAFDATGRAGLVHIAFPLKMLLQAD